MTVDADFYLEADAASIPTGRKLPVKGTPMDFTEEKTLGLDIGADFTPLTDCCGYDQCYVIRDRVCATPPGLSAPRPASAWRC